MFSTLMQISVARYGQDEQWTKGHEEEVDKAKKYVDFCCRLHRAQLEGGRYFLHGHPWFASPLNLEGILESLADDRAMTTRGDQCQSGLRTHVANKDGEQGYEMQPIGFMGSSWVVMDTLDCRCPRDPSHASLFGWLSVCCR